MCALELKDETFEGVCAVDWDSPLIYEEYNQGDKIWLHDDRRSFLSLFFFFFFK